MSEPAKSTFPSPPGPTPPAVRRDRSHEARRAARVRKAEREQRIVTLLNRGVSVAEIAAREGLSLTRMRGLVREILAKRMPQPPAEFLATQVSRLNEALLVCYTSKYNDQTGPNFEAIDRVVKIVRELDRYHGLAAREREPREDRRRLASRPSPLALAAPSPELDVTPNNPLPITDLILRSPQSGRLEGCPERAARGGADTQAPFDTAAAPPAHDEEEGRVTAVGKGAATD
jgi:DNA-binding CsgD family transcriptional regulator